MTRKRSNLAVHVEVLQNGAPLASIERPLDRSGVLALHPGEGDLGIPHYPIPNGRLEFLEIQNGKVNLIIDYRWEGFVTSGGNLVNIARGEKGRQILELGKGDYGSIARDDLRIMVKLAPPTPLRAKKKLSPEKGYRESLLGLVIGGKADRRGLAVGLACALVTLGGFLFGLSKRPYEPPKALADLPESFVLPFMAPEHLETAPETLQSTLDRKRFLPSVIAHYDSVTKLLMGWEGYDRRYLFDSTANLYEGLHLQRQARLEDLLRKQKETDDKLSGRPGAGIFALPAVLGETADGAILRALDKVKLAQEGARTTLAAKREIREVFEKEQVYDSQEYRNVRENQERTQEYLAAARPFKQLTNEELMYLEAEGLAARAKAARRSIQRTRGTPVDPSRHRPLALPGGATYASFLTDFDFAGADDKLYRLQASVYGTQSKKPEIKEPLIGEIDPAVVENYIKKRRYQLMLCYETALRRNEAASGTMQWSWRIDSRGNVSDIVLETTTIKDSRMAQCIRQKIASWRFPRPRRGSVQVRYPFEFAPAKG